MKWFTTLCKKADKADRQRLIKENEEIIYQMFYTTKVELNDIERAESLERVLERIKNDLKERKQKRQSEFLETEQALDKL